MTGHNLTNISPAAQRMRLHRERRRQRLRCVTVELREAEITALIRRGHLHLSTFFAERHRAGCPSISRWHTGEACDVNRRGSYDQLRVAS